MPLCSGITTSYHSVEQTTKENKNDSERVKCCGSTYTIKKTIAIALDFYCMKWINKQYAALNSWLIWKLWENGSVQRRSLYLTMTCYSPYLSFCPYSKFETVSNIGFWLLDALPTAAECSFKFLFMWRIWAAAWRRRSNSFLKGEIGLRLRTPLLWGDYFSVKTDLQLYSWRLNLIWSFTNDPATDQ